MLNFLSARGHDTPIFLLVLTCRLCHLAGVIFLTGRPLQDFRDIWMCSSDCLITLFAMVFHFFYHFAFLCGSVLPLLQCSMHKHDGRLLSEVTSININLTFNSALRNLTSLSITRFDILSNSKTNVSKTNLQQNSPFTICRDILSTLARAFGKRFWPAQS